jgi:hypothetical protein
MADSMSTPLEPVPENGEKVAGGLDVENGAQLSEYDAVVDGEIEKQLVRKLDWNLVPLVMAICELPVFCGCILTDPDLLSFLDRGNIGFVLYPCISSS